MQHRIFLAPLRPGVAHVDAHAHWCGNHGRIMLDLPELAGYVQNRPLPAWWPHLGYLACSETWFADREAERTAYASEWYRETITPDEHRMFARDDAWSAVVTEAEELHPGPPEGFRALAFGGAPANLGGTIADGRLELLRLTRPAPGLTDPVLVSAYAEDEGKAALLAMRLGGLAFVAEAATIVPPPD